VPPASRFWVGPATRPRPKARCRAFCEAVIQPDGRSEQAELDRLQDVLGPPGRLGGYDLTGLVARTETALVYSASGGVFGADEGVLKLTTRGYAPLLARELELLVRCADADVDGLIRPRLSTPLRLTAPSPLNMEAFAMALPFYRGGNLIDVIARRARRAGLGSGFALRVCVTVGSTLRGLLALPRPLVHGDVRAQNVLLPSPDADLTALTLIDLDAARELPGRLPEIASDPSAAETLAEDVRGFGELLFELVSGKESASTIGSSTTSNVAFDALVLRCQSSAPDVRNSYVCLADEALWWDVQKALDLEARLSSGRGAASLPFWRALRKR
jgi:hypothetical protein